MKYLRLRQIWRTASFSANNGALLFKVSAPTIIRDLDLGVTTPVLDHSNENHIVRIHQYGIQIQ